jgi:hypothetical protein
LLTGHRQRLCATATGAEVSCMVMSWFALAELPHASVTVHVLPYKSDRTNTNESASDGTA